MKIPQLPQDDLTDVMEMTLKMEAYNSNLMKDNDDHIAMSALIGGSINSMVTRCKNPEQVMFYGNVFIQLLIKTIESVMSKEPE